jgi:hypothetical protein
LQAVLIAVPGFRSGRSADNGRSWLSMLVDAMEDAVRPERRAQPCDRATLAGLRAQLARPAPFHPQGVTAFSRRN